MLLTISMLTDGTILFMSNADIGFLCSLMINDIFLPEPRNMASISRVKEDESCKPYMGASGSSANVIIISQNNKHSADIQGMKNIDTRGTILEVIARDERSDEDSCRVTSGVVGVFGPPTSKFVFTRLAQMVCSEDTRVYTGSGGTSLRPVRCCS